MTMKHIRRCVLSAAAFAAVAAVVLAHGEAHAAHEGGAGGGVLTVPRPPLPAGGFGGVHREPHWGSDSDASRPPRPWHNETGRVPPRHVPGRAPVHPHADADVSASSDDTVGPDSGVPVPPAPRGGDVRPGRDAVAHERKARFGLLPLPRPHRHPRHNVSDSDSDSDIAPGNHSHPHPCPPHEESQSTSGGPPAPHWRGNHSGHEDNNDVTPRERRHGEAEARKRHHKPHHEEHKKHRKHNTTEKPHDHHASAATPKHSE